MAHERPDGEAESEATIAASIVGTCQKTLEDFHPRNGRRVVDVRTHIAVRDAGALVHLPLEVRVCG
jgi:hypothetical protein